MFRMKRFKSKLFLSVLTCLLLVALPSVNQVKAYNYIYIKADGTVEGTANILRNQNSYNFTDNVNGTVYVEKDDIVIDGAGYTLQGNDARGVVVSGRKNVTVRNLRIEATSGHGFDLEDSENCNVSGVTLVGDSIAMRLFTAYNNTIENCTITGSRTAIDIGSSHENKFKDNELTNNTKSIDMQHSSGNVFRNNHMSNFDLRFNKFSEYVNDMDSSNTAYGLPIIYWVEQQDRTVPLDAGCVILVKCARITVENLTFTKNGQYILMVNSTLVTVRNNTLTTPKKSSDGIGLIFSEYNVIFENNIQNKSTGIELQQSTNNLIQGNIVANCSRGIRPLYSSNNNTITSNIITANEYGIDDLQTSSSTYTTISSNIITSNSFGIALVGNNFISDNQIKGNGAGIVMNSGGDTITGNIVEYNNRGIVIAGGDNVLKGNQMNNNTYNFLGSNSATNDIDESNRINGKVVYHWVNQKDKRVPSDAGYVALFNCVNIKVQNLELANNGHGIMMHNTTKSTITQNVFTLNSVGVALYNSKDNTISQNHMTKNVNGMNIANSVENQITYNNIAENSRWAICFTDDQKDNSFHHNNFIDTKVTTGLQVSMDKFFGSGLGNSWDDGKEGNYWSDYQTRYTNATEVNNSGTGNTPFYINENNQDNHPLT
ncbi:MAG: right-handed parallel beta-helix repeat-containing protein, partial [Candidatus Bathyarchaeota archaeon]|nr:right-handed parallel beta-helix repeat-containing protein [Candidatus Bathyarchaeota archaeon]